MRLFQKFAGFQARTASRIKGRCFQAAVENTRCFLFTNRGNILVYIVMVMVIFAALGVTMLSLFSTSTSSSAVANSDRRAFNLYESGYRYALSELTRTSFSSSTVTTLNTTTYSLPLNGQFLLNVFGPWFDRTAPAPVLSAGDPLNLRVPRGKLPSGFAIPAVAPHVSVVNLEYTGGSISASGSSAEVTGYNYTDPTHFSLTVGDDFVANLPERIRLAVHPDQDQTVSDGGNLTVALQAQGIFPKFNGAIEVNRRLLFYRERVDDSINVNLTHLKAKSGSFTSFPVAAADYVILSQANYYIVPEGRSAGVSYGGSMNYAVCAYDVTPPENELPPDYKAGEQKSLQEEFSKNESIPGFVEFDETNKKVKFERTSGTPFASVLFKDTRSIGGQTGFCQDGRCLFGDGIRAFFVMTFTGPGDGFTFSLLNAGNNTTTSVGGDFELGELMGYAGDSRLDNNSPTPTYLDGTGNGLRPPKMALEFDGFYNNSPVGYCFDEDTVNTGTRFDPAFSGSGRDNVQYVFWGNRISLAAPCRGNSPLYDDNRHNPQASAAIQWTYSPVGTQEITQRIKTGPDGTVYAVSGDNSSSSDSRLIALDPFSGSLKWQFPAPSPTPPESDDDLDAIAVDNAGNIYLGSDDNKVFARTPGGGQLWAPFSAGGQVESPIAVSESPNRIYFGVNDLATGNGILYALNKSNGNPIWAYSKPESGEIQSGVAIDPGNLIDLTDDTIYFGTDTARFLYAVNADGTQRWKYPSSSLSGNIRTQPVVNPSNRDIIFATTNGQVYALPYSDTSTAPTRRWIFDTGGSVGSALAISPDGNTVYVGTTGGVLYALDAKTSTPSGSQRWKYPSSGSIGAIRGKPAVDSDGTVYVGTDNGKVYALNPDTGPLTDDQRLKWVFPSSGSIGSVKSAIEIGKDGNILFISDDGKLYSINPFITPSNLRDLSLTDNELQAGVSGADWFGLGTWAVRVEVDRSQSPNANGKYEYTLRTWMRRCTDATNCSDIAPTLFGNTRLRYDYKPLALTALPMAQTIEIADADHTLFERFLFGFTSGSGSDQTINISKFQLSFIRPNDPVATADPDWP
jgi:outer membrane protein assembly factor BamB